MAPKKQLTKVRLSTNPDAAALRALNIGDIVYLDGIVYTAREGVYKKVIEDGAEMPVPLPELSGANFHCSPAATRKDAVAVTALTVKLPSSSRVAAGEQ